MNKQKKYSLARTDNFSKQKFNQVLVLAEKLKKNRVLYPQKLKNKTIALIFAKPSLRTRVSFEVGITELGGKPLTIKMDEISIGSREDIEDIGKVLSRYVHGIIIRTFEQEQIDKLVEVSSIPIINALSNDEHPCQAIADIFTVQEKFKKTQGLKLAYIGDGNNVAHSLMICCALAEMDFSIACPKGFEPMDKYVQIAKRIYPKGKIVISNSPQKASENASVLYTDVWTSMGQEREMKKRLKLFADYQINEKLLKVASRNAIVMHCLPAHKGQEISHDVFNKFSNIIYTQAENRLHVQKAIMATLF